MTEQQTLFSMPNVPQEKKLVVFVKDHKTILELIPVDKDGKIHHICREFISKEEFVKRDYEIVGTYTENNQIRSINLYKENFDTPKFYQKGMVK